MRTPTIPLLHGLSTAVALTLAIIAGAAQAEPAGPSAGNADPSFGSRTEKPDGSVAMTMGRRLPTELDAKVGTDLNLAGPSSSVPSENFVRGAPPDRSTGAVWGNITMSGLVPQVWDKTTIEARVDAGNDQGKLGATLSRSVPLGRDVSVTVQNSYAVTQTLSDRQNVATAVPMMTTPAPAGASDGAATWTTDQSVRLNIDSSGTAFSAGGSTSNLDEQWHNKLSVEQKLFGPLKVTTSVEDAGSTASKKSITAGFKQVW